jgi:L-fucose isomerase-like protein
VEVDNYDMAELVGRLDGLDRSRIDAEIVAMLEAAPADRVEPSDMRLTAGLALALRDLAKERRCDALAVSDWPQLQVDPGIHPGAAFSWLEEVDRLPIASEGDVMGAVSQFLSVQLGGRVGYLLDMTAPDFAEDSILLWHGGGGPLHGADRLGARWIPHPMLGRGSPGARRKGAILSLRFREGPITLFRVGQSGRSLFAAEARITERGDRGFEGVRGWATDFNMGGVGVSAQDLVSTVMAYGLEHHFTLVEGRQAAVLEEFGAWTGQGFVAPIPYRGMLRSTDYQ